MLYITLTIYGDVVANSTLLCLLCSFFMYNVHVYIYDICVYVSESLFVNDFGFFPLLLLFSFFFFSVGSEYLNSVLFAYLSSNSINNDKINARARAHTHIHKQ